MANYNVLFDYSIKAYNKQGEEVGFNNIWTLQGNFVCNDQTTFFNLPNALGEGQRKTTGNQWIGNSSCNSASVESLMCDKITFEINMQGYDDPKFITVPGTSVLPVELITFDAYKKDRKVELFWKTATETNNDFFTISRSIDGQYWEDIQEIKGAGNSYQAIEYTYTDNTPYSGVSYYKLTQVDFDGTQKSFPIISVEQKELKILHAYPNPITHTATLVGADENSPIRLYNTIGVEVTENVHISKYPSKNTFIDMSNLPKGMYFVVNGTERIQIMKQ